MGRTNYLPLSLSTQPFSLSESTEAEFLDEIQAKVLKVFLLAIKVTSTCSFALRFLHIFKLTQSLTVSEVQLVYFSL